MTMGIHEFEDLFFFFFTFTQPVGILNYSTAHFLEAVSKLDIVWSVSVRFREVSNNREDRILF